MKIETVLNYRNDQKYLQIFSSSQFRLHQDLCWKSAHKVAWIDIGIHIKRWNLLLEHREETLKNLIVIREGEGK